MGVAPAVPLTCIPAQRGPVFSKSSGNFVLETPPRGQTGSRKGFFRILKAAPFLFFFFFSFLGGGGLGFATAARYEW